MINANLLRGKIVAAGFTQGEFAERLMMSKNTLSAKINGRSDFSLFEVRMICKVLGITADEVVEIFLPEQSH